MSWSIPIGVVGGTVIRIHVTFLLLLLWIAIAEYMQGGTQAAVQGVVYVAGALLSARLAAWLRSRYREGLLASC